MDVEPSVRVVVLDSITKLDAAHAGQVVVAASHGGAYPGYLAARGGVRAVILNDAGLGKDDAGIDALAFLAALGIPAAAAAHQSARIGDGADLLASGRLSRINAPAAGAGCQPGMAVAEAAQRLRVHRPLASAIGIPTQAEARHDLVPGAAVPVAGLDSVSLLAPGDRGAIVVTASHGGVLAQSGSDSVAHPVLAVSFHDAGGGKDDAGYGRLPLLQARGLAAVTVAGHSARIGDARSCYVDGVLSRANACAQALGAREGMRLKAFIAGLLARHEHTHQETQEDV
ncbi:hypothetical protein IMZ29_13350 [Achromobacter sp. GG226]|nr:hypothetical protein [Verticiella sp. GG226]